MRPKSKIEPIYVDNSVISSTRDAVKSQLRPKEQAPYGNGGAKSGKKEERKELFKKVAKFVSGLGG